MDFAQLEAMLQASLSNQVFKFALNQLNDLTLTKLADDYLPNGELHLEHVPEIGQDVAAQRYTIIGQGLSTPFKGLTTTCTFQLVAGVWHVQLTAEGALPNPIGLAFVEVNGSWLADLPFQASPQWRLVSHPTPALTLAGVGDFTSLAGGIANLLGQPTHELTGTFELAKHGANLQSIELDAPVLGPTDLGLFQVNQVVLGVKSELVPSPKPPSQLIPALVLATSIPFHAQQQTYNLGLAVYARNLAQNLHFRLDLNQVLQAGFDELASLAHGYSLGQLIPQGLHLEDYFTLSDFFFDFDYQNPHKISLIGLDVRSTSTWDILTLPTGSSISIGNILLAFRLSEPLSSEIKPFLAVSGEVVLDTAILDISTNLPDWEFQAHLREGTTLHVAKLIDLTLGHSAHLPELNIYDLYFGVSSEGFTFHAGISDLWELVPGKLRLTDLAVGLNYATAGGVYLGIEVGFDISSVTLTLTGEYQSSQAGWALTGSTGYEQPIPIGELLDDLVSKFGAISLPTPLTGLIIKNIHAGLNTGSFDTTFDCEIDFPVSASQHVALLLKLAIIHESNGIKADFSGHITLGSLIFDLRFHHDPSHNAFIASYSHTAEQAAIHLRELLGYVWADVPSAIPDIQIDLKDVVFLFDNTGTVKVFVFGFDLGARISLADLPLIGSKFPPDWTVGLENLQVLVVSGEIPKTTIVSLNALLPETVTGLPDQDLTKGLNITAKLQLGSSRQALNLPIAGQDQTAPAKPTTPTQAGSSSTDTAQWFNIQKSLGPVHFERIGVQYSDSVLWFLIDASLSAAGLTLSMQGLGVGSRIDKFEPHFTLRGIGIDFKRPPLEIGGALLRVPSADGDDYLGMAIIRASSFGLAAMGGYSTYKGWPSLFVYAALNTPIGGPPYFFVMGLAAGFGFNRALNIPPVGDLLKFPFVSEALGIRPNGTTITDELLALHQYVPPTTGQLFFAAGLHFTTFKVLDAFALLTISVGTSQLEVNLLGLATVAAPPTQGMKDVDPLASLQLALKATLDLLHGYVELSGQLTSESFILDRNCRITGGFAIAAWFGAEHTGDFVITLGGYHPQFNVPSHYPKVPRLGLNWQLADTLSLKGGLYFAMNGSAMMAGGELQLTWESGDLKAWLKAGIDFLIAWKPFHYDVHLYVDIGVSYTLHFLGTHRLSVDIGADLHIWGPEFSGIAKLDLKIFSFEIKFGAAAPALPKPINWIEFQASFLPASQQVLSLTVERGLSVTNQAQADQQPWLINPKELSLNLASAVPISTLMLGSSAINLATSNTRLGVAPLNLPLGHLNSVCTISIRLHDQPAEQHFQLELVHKNAPAALWGDNFIPQPNSPSLVDNTLSGVRIVPIATHSEGETAGIDPQTLLFVPEAKPETFAWKAAVNYTASAETPTERELIMRSNLDSAEVQTARSQLLQALGQTAICTINHEYLDGLADVPQLGSWTIGS